MTCIFFTILFSVLTSIVDAPPDFAVIRPFWFTIATFWLLLLHVIFLLLEFSGKTVALTLNVSPIDNSIFVWSNNKFVTFTGFDFKYIFIVSVNLPSSDVTVISAVPEILDFVVIFPKLSISINCGLLLSHVTFLFVALFGSIL